MEKEAAQVDQPVACMPHLLNADLQLSQLESTEEGSKGKEAEGSAERSPILHGHAEQSYQDWGMLPKDGGSTEHMDSEHVSQPVQLDASVTE
jgi:hypothetical protein